jgi:hypothetical protein
MSFNFMWEDYIKGCGESDFGRIVIVQGEGAWVSCCCVWSEFLEWLNEAQRYLDLEAAQFVFCFRE